MCKTVFRNNLQTIGLPRPVADWLTESATDAEVESLSGSSAPDAADVRATARAILTRITAAIAE